MAVLEGYALTRIEPRVVQFQDELIRIVAQRRRRFASHGLDDELREINSFTRIGVPRPWREVDLELAVRLERAPVREAAGMAQEHAKREPLVAVVAAEIDVGWIARQRLGQILGDRPVEIEDDRRDIVHVRSYVVAPGRVSTAALDES
jgi:hypothetical protein